MKKKRRLPSNDWLFGVCSTNLGRGLNPIPSWHCGCSERVDYVDFWHSTFFFHDCQPVALPLDYLQRPKKKYSNCHQNLIHFFFFEHSTPTSRLVPVRATDWKPSHWLHVGPSENRFLEVHPNEPRSSRSLLQRLCEFFSARWFIYNCFFVISPDRLASDNWVDGPLNFKGIFLSSLSLLQNTTRVTGF